MIYLTAPYYHQNPDVRKARIHCINEVLVNLKRADSVDIYCDILTNHAVNTLDSDIKITPIKKILAACSSVMIYCLPGWEKDENIHKIKQYAEFLGIRVNLTPVYGHHLTEPYKRVWELNSLTNKGYVKRW